MVQTLRSIQKTIEWYDTLPAGFIDIELLINARRLLSTRLYKFAGHLAEFNRDKIAAEHVRKSFEASKRAELMKSSEGKPIASHVEAMVQKECIPYRQKETEFEQDFSSAKIIYQAAMNVCDVMNQHIANLRGEKNRETINQGSQG